MSSQQHDTDEASEQTVPVIEGPNPPIEYEPADRQTRRRQFEVAENWVGGVYPDNERSDRDPGVISTGRYTARQYDDGTGQVRWNRLTEAYRTISGLVLVNANMTGIDTNHTARSVRRACTSHGVDSHSLDVPFVEQALEELLDTRIRRSSNYHLTKVTDIQRDDAGKLLTFTNGDQLFVGTDETAHGSGRFAFHIAMRAPVPSPERALDLLMPDPVLHAEAKDVDVPRQGEWFFVPGSATEAPRHGTIQKPGVAERPYGGSPLDNHVPRDWAPVYEDSDVADRFSDHDDITFVESTELPKTPQEVVEFYNQGRMHYESSLTWENLLQEILGGVWVRGTIRHRDNDHFVTNLGDEWHLAVTHDAEVVTEDDVGRVRVD